MSKTIAEHRCNHCGLETLGGATPSECARCGRTFFVTRYVTSPDELENWQEMKMAETVAKAQLRIAKRRQIASDIRHLLNTGWCGYRHIASKAERTSLAKELAASAPR